MRSHTVFRLPLAVSGLLLAALAHAQTAPAPADLSRDGPARDRTNQRVEHIQHEDAGSRVNELRVGGETKTIAVQPKAGVPPYQVQPADPSGVGASSRESGPGSAGRRVWKLRDF